MHVIFQPLANLTSVHSVQFLRLAISFPSAAVLHSAREATFSAFVALPKPSADKRRT